MGKGDTMKSRESCGGMGVEGTGGGAELQKQKGGREREVGKTD